MRHPGSLQLEPLEPRQHFDLTIEGTTIDGVLPAALDQPQIHALFRTTPDGDPLVASDGGFSTFDVSAFLDTGTSGMLLSKETAEGLGINKSQFNGQDVVYGDVGVGGIDNFFVSDPVYTALAPFTPNADVDNINTFETVYSQKYGPVRTEIAQQPADDLLGPLDILGMPLLMNKVMVMDPRPVENIENMHTFVYDPGTPFNPGTEDDNPGIPTTNLHVKMSFGDFSRFTLLSPTGAPGPSLADNPFIGPDPTGALAKPNPINDGTPAVQLKHGNFTSTGSFLFDTGAAASFISVAQAENVHVHYKEGTYGTDQAELVDDNGQTIPNQFQIPLGGIGGTLTAAGFYMDELTLPTMEGSPITFKHAPVLVVDIKAEDPVTGDIITLDGDFGMNYLVASADISGGFLIGGIEPGAFNWAVYDAKNNVLGLDLKGWDAETTAPTASLDTSSATSSAGNTMQFKVTYTDNAAMLTSSIDNADLLVTGPGGYSQLATKVSTSQATAGKSIIVTYSIPQPTQNGAYTVAVQSGEVTDLSANPVAAASIGSINLNSPSIAGTVFKDSNANSIREANDTGLAGWTVYLDKNNSNTLDAGDVSTSTDANGRYFFNNQPTGSAAVRVVFQSGYRKTTPSGAAGFNLSLAANQTAGANDFGVTTNILLSGVVYNDTNHNGSKDAGEVGLSLWRVFVDLNNNGTWDTGEPTRNTDTNGSFQFKGLAAGTGTVRVEVQAGWTKSNPASGSYSGSVTNGTIFPGLNFGLFQSAAAIFAAPAAGILEGANDELNFFAGE